MPDTSTEDYFVVTCFITNSEAPKMHLYGPFPKAEADQTRRDFLQNFNDNESRPWDSTLIVKVTRPIQESPTK